MYNKFLKHNYKNLFLYKSYLTISLIILSLFISSCSESTEPNNTSKAGTFKGASVNLGNGSANSWVTLDSYGYPVSIGLTMTAAAFDSLGTEMTETILTMPTEAALTNIKMIAIDWNPMGHEPPGIYDISHFDFHFYMVDMAFRTAITAMGDDTLKCNKQPMSGYLPDGYMLFPGGIPTMGAHAADLSSPELNGSVFTETFIYGYYDGNMIFYEPMITRAFLLGKQFTEKTLKTPAKYPSAGYYPSKMKIEYDDVKKEYMIYLTGMTKFSM